MTIGHAIKTLRARRHMSQQELASKAKINQGFLSSIEKGQRQPSLPMVKRIADALKVPPQLLFLVETESIRSRTYSKQLKKIAQIVDKILLQIGSLDT